VYAVRWLHSILSVGSYLRALYLLVHDSKHPRRRGHRTHELQPLRDRLAGVLSTIDRGST